MRKKSLAFLATLVLSACSTSTPTATSPSPIAVPKMPVAQLPVTPSDADLAKAQQFCQDLHQKLQVQLPAQALSKIHFNVRTVNNPFAANKLSAACIIDWNTDGGTIQKLGLTPNFMIDTLERLDWQTPTNLTSFTADGPTDHQQAMQKDQWQGLVNYAFVPPAGACSNNQPLAACKFSKKKWLYALKAQFVAGA